MALAACAPDVPEGLSASIDRIVRTAMAQGPITGVAVSVAQGSSVVHEAGYGFADVENGIPITPETVFKVGSITKQFTAATVLDLADEGALSLEDPLTDYVPDYPGYGPQVTISHLLSHTSGIKNYTTMQEWWETLAVEMPPARLVDMFRDEPFDFRPGTEFVYSNSGYVLLGLIAERVTGQPFGGILNERLFVPLELESTRYCDDRAIIPNRARGYVYVDGQLMHSAHMSMSQAYAAGGVCSTVQDLFRWSRLLWAGVAIGRGGYEAMVRPATLRDGTPIEYGYGMAIGYLEGHHRVSHVGGMLGFAGQIAHYDDDDMTIIVLTNTEGAKASAIEREIARLMLDLGDQEVRDLRLTPAELEQYTGIYDLRITRVTVRVQDGHLHTEVTVPGLEGSHTLLYQGAETFVSAADPDVSVTFLIEDGRARRFVLTHKGITIRGARVEGA